MAEQAALSDTGYHVNFLQKGGVKQVLLTLTNSSLEIKEVDSNKVLVDVPLEKVSLVKATSRLYSTLIGIGSQGANLKIKADGKTYKIAWKDPDPKTKISNPSNAGLGAIDLGMNALDGYKRAKQWEDTFNKFKSA